MASVEENANYLIELPVKLSNHEDLLREVAFGTLVLTKERIHMRGERADGTPIGEYKDRYLKVRQGKYNRTSDRTMIFSLTRDMENQYKVIELSETEYGLGWDTDDGKKSQWLIEKFGDNIWDLSESELSAIDDIIQDYIDRQ